MKIYRFLSLSISSFRSQKVSGNEIIDIPEALTLLKTQRAQPYVAGIGTGAAIVLAVHVEGVQVCIAPVESDLEHCVELCQGGIAADEESAPDERTDLAQDDAQLIDAGWFNGLMHAQSVPSRALRFKMSPRYLAVSMWRLPGRMGEIFGANSPCDPAAGADVSPDVCVPRPD